MRPFPSLAARLVLTILAAPIAAGCGAAVDMTAAGPERATMTVPYTNVRAEVRLYPDYGPIGASILVDDAAVKDDPHPVTTKKGKP